MISKFYTAVAFFLILFITSCGKGDNSSGNGLNSDAYIKCNIDGQVRNFSYYANANDKPASDKVQAVVIGGWEGSDMLKTPAIVIRLNKLDGIIPGEYSSENKTYELSSDYYYQEYKNGVIDNTVSYTADGSLETDIKLSITSLNNWGVKGKFSGKYRLSTSNEWKTITNGEFAVPYN